MLKIPNDYFKQPELYEKTEVSIWNEKHISKQLLEAHLEPNYDGATRNLEFVNESVSWIESIVPTKKFPKMLDIGCGPGIYAELFAEAGYQVAGVDFSKQSIEYAKKSARKKNYDIHYIYQNYLELDLSEKFDFITMIYCDYGALSTKEREILRQIVLKHLKPGGKFLLDVFSISKYSSIQESTQWNYSCDSDFWCSEPHLTLSRTAKYEDCVILDQTIVITEEDYNIYNVWTTHYTSETLINEFSSKEFKCQQTFGDVKGSPYDNRKHTIAFLLEKTT